MADRVNHRVHAVHGLIAAVPSQSSLCRLTRLPRVVALFCLYLAVSFRAFSLLKCSRQQSESHDSSRVWHIRSFAKKQSSTSLFNPTEAKCEGMSAVCSHSRIEQLPPSTWKLLEDSTRKKEVNDCMTVADLHTWFILCILSRQWTVDRYLHAASQTVACGMPVLHALEPLARGPRCIEGSTDFEGEASSTAGIYHRSSRISTELKQVKLGFRHVWSSLSPHCLDAQRSGT